MNKQANLLLLLLIRIKIGYTYIGNLNCIYIWYEN